MKPSVLEVRRVEALETIAKLSGVMGERITLVDNRAERIEKSLAAIEAKLDQLLSFQAASRPPAPSEVRRGKQS